MMVYNTALRGGGGVLLKTGKLFLLIIYGSIHTDKDHVFLFLVTTRVQCSSNEGSGGAWEGVGDGPCFG